MDRPLPAVALAPGAPLAKTPPPSLVESSCASAALLAGPGWAGRAQATSEGQGGAHAAGQLPHDCDAAVPKADCCEPAAGWAPSSPVEIGMESVAPSGCK